MTIHTMTVGEQTFGTAGILEARRMAKELAAASGQKLTTVSIRMVKLSQRDASAMIAAALKRGSKEFELPEGEIVDIVVYRAPKQAQIPGIEKAA